MEMHPDQGYEVLWDLTLIAECKTEEDHRKNEATKEKFRRLEAFTPPAGMTVRDRTIPGPPGAPDLTLRIYRMEGMGVTPVLMDFHGGGFVIGDLDKDNNRCAAYCAGVPCTVVQVGYRLAPAAVFPAQLEDCCAGLCWVRDHAPELGVDPERIALHGSSAGAALAAGLALYCRDRGGPAIAFQILNYPVLDLGDPVPSAIQTFDGAPIITGRNRNDALKMYLGGFDGRPVSYYAVPGLCPDVAGLPPTAIVTCEYCPLRDDGLAFAQRLLRAGVPTELYSLPRVPHAYDLVPAPRTLWIQEGLCLSLRREFGL